MKKILIMNLLFVLLSVGCSDAGKQKEMEVNKTSTTIQKADLVVNPQDVEGNQGQITFTQSDKTVFYFNIKEKKGKIVLNGVGYILTDSQYNSDDNTYTLSGAKIKIKTSACKFDEEQGGDCMYGKMSTVNISLDNESATINNVSVQDCPDYS